MFLKSTYDQKPKINIINSAQFGKSYQNRFRDDSGLRKQIELEYRQTVTRTLDDDEISKHVPENLVEKILASYHKKVQKRPRNQPKQSNLKLGEFDSNSFYAGDRRKMVHSAPTHRNQVNFQVKSFSDRGEQSQYTFRSAQSSNTYLKNAKLQHTSKKDAEKKINWNFKNKQNELKTQSKSIMRSQKPIVAKSLNVEKWIGIHRRRSANTMLASQADSSSQEEDFSKYEFLSIPNQKKSRSIRELSDLTMLDKVQERIRRDINEKIKNLRKIESKNEFNAIVNRIKAFLDDLENPIETSSFVSSVSTFRNEKITLYELAIA